MTVSDTRHQESVTLSVKKYGYATLRLGADSSYEFDLAVLRDVLSERPMFGVNQNVVLLKAVYKSSRFGKFHAVDSGIQLESKDGVIFVTEDSINRSLIARFRDESSRSWVCTLTAKEN